MVFDELIMAATHKYFLTLKNNYNTGNENRVKKNTTKAKHMREVSVSYRTVFTMRTHSDEHQFTNEERNTVRIIDNRIYSAKVLRVNYTTYDVRRDQDSMNPNTERRDIMVLSPEE